MEKGVHGQQMLWNLVKFKFKAANMQQTRTL